MTVKGTKSFDNSPKQRQRPRSRTRHSDQKLSHLPMLEDETHELPLPRRIDPAPSPTTERKRGSIKNLVVAIKRFSDHLTKSKNPDATKGLKEARILLPSGIVNVTIRSTKAQVL